jgi:hypothetical protein
MWRLYTVGALFFFAGFFSSSAAGSIEGPPKPKPAMPPGPKAIPPPPPRPKGSAAPGEAPEPAGRRVKESQGRSRDARSESNRLRTSGELREAHLELAHLEPLELLRRGRRLRLAWARHENAKQRAAARA